MPTKYTQAQRNEMHRLYREGLQPMEISRRMAEGSGDLPPLDIPRKSVESIVKTMESKAAHRRRADRETEDPREQAQRLRRRIQMTIETEIDRIEVAQGNGKAVDPKRLNELAKAIKVLASPDPGRPRGPATPAGDTPAPVPAKPAPNTLAAMVVRNREPVEPSTPEADADPEEPASADTEAKGDSADKARQALAQISSGTSRTPSLAHMHDPANGNGARGAG